MRHIWSLVFIYLLLGGGSTALARTAVAPEYPDFLAACREFRANTVSLAQPPPSGKITFLPTLSLEANQDRFSFILILRKLKKALKNEPGAYVDPKRNQWVLPYDEGRSFYPESKAIQGLFYRGKVFILDGHHRGLISTYLGSPTLPVYIKDDLSDRFTPRQFENYLAENHLSYFRSPEGATTARVDLCDMIDDPNLQLARLLIARVSVDFQKGKLTRELTKGEKWILGVKTPLDIPYLEFSVADALHRQGVRWDDTREQVLRRSEVEHYAQLLRRETKHADSRLEELFLFDHPTKLEDVDLGPQLLQHLRRRQCSEALTVRAIP